MDEPLTPAQHTRRVVKDLRREFPSMAPYSSISVARLVGPMIQAIQIRRSSGGKYTLQWYYSSVWWDADKPDSMHITSEWTGLPLQSVLPRSHEKFFPIWIGKLRNGVMKEPTEGDISFAAFADHMEPWLDDMAVSICPAMILLTKFYNKPHLWKHYETRLIQSHEKERVNLSTHDKFALEATPESLRASYAEIVKKKHFAKLQRSDFLF
jgi:hypothetical protein